MLVLLVMLIITIPIQTHAVKMDMPQATPPTADETQPPPVVELEIDFDGTIIWNGMVIPSRHALEVQLLQAANAQIGTAHVRTPVTHAQRVCRLPLENKICTPHANDALTVTRLSYIHSYTTL